MQAGPPALRRMPMRMEMVGITAVGRGGRGGCRINFRDPAVQDAMKAYMEKPEVKAKMAEFQTQQEKEDAQLMAAVHRTLGKRQDRQLQEVAGCAVRPHQDSVGGPGRGFGRNGAGNQADATKNAPNTKAASGFDDDEPAAKSPSTTTSSPEGDPPGSGQAQEEESRRRARARRLSRFSQSVAWPASPFRLLRSLMRLTNPEPVSDRSRSGAGSLCATLQDRIFLGWTSHAVRVLRIRTWRSMTPQGMGGEGEGCKEERSGSCVMD